MWPFVKSWPFPDPKNTATFTLHSIINRRTFIRAVWHNSDGAWQFLDGSETPDLSDGAVVSLEEMTRLDPSILTLADLPRGWVAHRRSPSSPWQRQPDPSL